MAMTMHPSLAVHPGDWLKSEVVDPHGVSINRLAASFHVTRQTLSNLFNGHTSLSADMAIRFARQPRTPPKPSWESFLKGRPKPKVSKGG